jgi:DNA-binding NarL/FixJ family response regulator
MRCFEFEREEYAVFEIDLIPSVGFEGLTRTEREVAGLLVHGLSYAQIARAGTKSVSTVGKQAARIYKKLAVNGRFELARVLSASHGSFNGSKLAP